MIGYKLTLSQKNDIQGKEYASYQAFNCVQDINDIWFTFLTPQDIVLITGTEYSWILNCTKGEYVAPLSPPLP
jgi:predicted phosphohydrolase